MTFINKLDRLGADAYRTLHQLRTKLNHSCALTQIPIGVESNVSGIIDLIEERAMYFDGEFGENVVFKDIPKDYLEKAKELFASEEEEDV